MYIIVYKEIRVEMQKHMRLGRFSETIDGRDFILYRVVVGAEKVFCVRY